MLYWSKGKIKLLYIFYFLSYSSCLPFLKKDGKILLKRNCLALRVHSWRSLLDWRMGHRRNSSSQLWTPCCPCNTPSLSLRLLRLRKSFLKTIICYIMYFSMMGFIWMNLGNRKIFIENFCCRYVAQKCFVTSFILS